MADFVVTAVFSHLFIFLEMINRFPMPVRRAAAGFLTRTCFFLLPGVQRAMVANLAVVAPDTSPAERKRMAARIVNNYGAYFVDYFGAFFSRRPPRREDFVSELVGSEHLREVQEAETGAVLVTPHVGNWELGLLALTDVRARLAVVTAPIASRNMRRKLESFRERLGVEVVTLESPERFMFTLKRLLTEGRIVVLLGDRYLGGVAETVGFFGRPARLPTGYLHVARILDLPVLPACIVRNESGRYTCIAEAPIRVGRTGDRDRDVRCALEQMVGIFEQQIRNHVMQWYQFTPVWEKA